MGRLRAVGESMLELVLELVLRSESSAVNDRARGDSTPRGAGGLI